MCSATNRKNILVIGCGVSGLSAATHLADRLDKNRYSVTILEKNDSPGGRARRFEQDGFTFDMGPSWYWMPDVIADYFNAFGKQVSDYYELVQLSPSYRVFFGGGDGGDDGQASDDLLDVPSDYEDYKNMLDSVEIGSSKKLDRYLAQAEYIYTVGKRKFMRHTGLPLQDVASLLVGGDWRRLNMLGNLSEHIRKHFAHPRLVQLMEFPAIFLGSLAKNLPAAYSLMNYIDVKLGTWYPMGGVYQLVKAMVALAEEKGVVIRYACEVRSIQVDEWRATRVLLASGESVSCDFVVASADYHHVDRQLLDTYYSNYGEAYWRNRSMAPSALIFYLGVSKRLQNLRHHNLFLDECVEAHTATLFDKANGRWPDKPLFYVSVPSVTDSTVAPEGMENVFVLVPLQSAVALDTPRERDACYDTIMTRLERLTGQDIRSYVVYKRSYAHTDFVADYNAYKGNAYGLANTISQTALFKPRTRNHLVPNLYYAGQLTVPGPGIPTCIMSGEIVANDLMKTLR